MLDNVTEETSVYLDPSMESLWFNFYGRFSRHPDSSNYFTVPYWANFSFKGEHLKSLDADKTTSKGGLFLHNKLADYDLDIHDTTNTFLAIAFQDVLFLNLISMYFVEDIGWYIVYKK